MKYFVIYKQRNNPEDRCDDVWVESWDTKVRGCLTEKDARSFAQDLSYRVDFKNVIVAQDITHK